MVTILKIYQDKQKNFTSIRWKLIAMYLLMLTTFIIVMNIVLSSVVLELYIEERKDNFNQQLNSVSSGIRYYMKSGELEMYSENIASVLSIYSNQIEAELYAFENSGDLVASSNQREESIEELEDTILDSALEGDMDYQTISSGDHKSMILARPIMSEGEKIGVIYAKTSIQDIYENIDTVNQSLIAISLLGGVIMIFIKFVFVGYVFKPLSQFISATRKISDGDLDYRVELNTNDEFKELADTFNAMTYRLREEDSQRKAFLAYVSHELKTPLSTIKLLSETLVHQDEIDMEVCREFLKDISSESDRLTAIVNDLLTMMELDTYEIEIDIEKASINAIIDKLYTNMKPLADEKNIKLDFSLGEEMEFYFDADRIIQTLINIVSNSIKYTEEGGRVALRLYRVLNTVYIEIDDTGIGIPKESLPHIFDRFYRVDKARARSTGGSGLGLSIAQQIIELHGGRIEVESELNVGTKFTIELPYRHTLD